MTTTIAIGVALVGVLAALIFWLIKKLIKNSEERAEVATELGLVKEDQDARDELAKIAAQPHLSGPDARQWLLDNDRDPS